MRYSGSSLMSPPLGRADASNGGRRRSGTSNFKQKKNDAYSALDSSNVDANGKRVIREYLDAFYEAIGSDEAFYRPAVVVSGMRAYADAAQASAVCSAMGTIPVGTVVSEPLETSDQMIRVILLDTQWQWATPKPCAAIHDGPVLDSARRGQPRLSDRVGQALVGGRAGAARVGAARFHPRRNHSTRCAELPCVKRSGITRPLDIRCSRSSPIAAAARSASSASPGSSSTRPAWNRPFCDAA